MTMTTCASFALTALSLYGYSANTAANGALALNELHRSHYDLVLTDLNMPQMSGTELIQQMRAEGNSIPVILTSGNSMAEIPPTTARWAWPHYWQSLSCWTNSPHSSKHLLKASSAWLVVRFTISLPN
jgi:CheY-like chemotaxis protein